MIAHNRLWLELGLAADELDWTEPSAEHDWDEYDEALAQVAGGDVKKDSSDARPESQAAAMLAGAAVAGTALRFVFRPSDGQKRRHWWSARFAPPAG